MKPNSHNKKIIASGKCKAKDLVKTITLMAQGIGATWKLDPTDTEIFNGDKVMVIDPDKLGVEINFTIENRINDRCN